VATKQVSKPRQQSGNSYEQATFIQVELSDAEREKCKAWDYDELTAFTDIENLMADGYKVTFRWDEYSECQACWILPAKDDPLNAGLILTGRGSTPHKAFKQAMYKHEVLFERAWPREKDTRGKRVIDD